MNDGSPPRSEMTTYANHQGLDSESTEFETYSRLSSEAKFAEALDRSSKFVMPLVLMVPMVFIDELSIGQDVLTDRNPWLVVAVSFYHLYLGYALTRAILHFVMGLLHVTRYRYLIDEDGIYVLSGVWVRSHQTFPRNRIQKVTVTQSYLQKKLDLTTLYAGATGVGVEVQHISSERAHYFRQQIIDQLNREPLPSDDV